MVPLIIAAIWGWLTGPVFVPSPFSPSSFNRTSHRTTQDTDEDRHQAKAKSFSLLGSVWDWLSGSFAAKSALEVLKPEVVPQTPLKVTPHREKRSLATFDLIFGALTHWFIPENFIKNTDELTNQTSPAFTPLSIQQCGFNQGSYSPQTRHGGSYCH